MALLDVADKAAGGRLMKRRKKAVERNRRTIRPPQSLKRYWKPCPSQNSLQDLFIGVRDARKDENNRAMCQKWRIRKHTPVLTPK
jgi:hypothetical protein